MADIKPKKTGFPLLIDSDVANTLDFHVASTDFLNVVDEYANHIAASYVWNYQKHVVDPISGQAQFFQKFNDSTLHLKDGATGQMGGVDNKVQTSIAKSAYMSILDTLLNREEVWIRGADNWPESRGPTQGEKQFEITWASGRKQVVSETRFSQMNLYRTGATVKELPRKPGTQTEGREYRALNLLTGRERWIPLAQDPQALVSRKMKNLELKWGAEDVQEEFLLYWFQKYRRAHDKVKVEYKKYITDERYNYFTELSDSIGILARADEHADNAMIPIADTEFNILGTVPSVTHPVANDKLDPETETLIREMSLKTNNLFRRNTVKMYRVLRGSNTSHGEDLQSDYLHHGRAIALRGPLDATIAETIGQAYKLLGYIRNAANEQKVKSPTFTVAVENSLIKVDFLKDKINAISSTRTNSKVLKAETIVKDLS